MQRHLVELTGQHLDGPGQLNLRQIDHLEAVHGHGRRAQAAAKVDAVFRL